MILVAQQIVPREREQSPNHLSVALSNVRSINYGIHRGNRLLTVIQFVPPPAPTSPNNATIPNTKGKRCR